MENKLLLAGAGCGKTTYLVKKALSVGNKSVLITTYTQANENEIRAKFFKLNKCIPRNIVIQTWFSFLIQHGLKPYQSYLYDDRINGLILVNQASGIKYTSKMGFPVQFKETEEFEQHYFTPTGKVYSDKLAKLVVRMNEESESRVISRICKIYSNIFIDESQDLAGHDLSIVKLLSLNSENLELVCDPRQVTYLTHLERKFGKYKDGKILEFVQTECKKSNFEIDTTSLSKSWRCNQEICDYSNLLYPGLPTCNSEENNLSGIDGIYMVKKKKCKQYLEQFNPVQLRWDARTETFDEYKTLNFGVSKGLTFERVLIYPTKDMLKWINNTEAKLSSGARAKFYVGITRAKYSVGIVYDEDDFEPIEMKCY